MELLIEVELKVVKQARFEFEMSKEKAEAVEYRKDPS